MAGGPREVVCPFMSVVPVVENQPASAEDVRGSGSIPGSQRSPGGGHGNPLQYSRLENPMDREAIGSQESDTTEVT